MTWLPKSVVCLSYYDRFRFRSDGSTALILALKLFPVAIAIAVATGIDPIYGVSCAAAASLVASALGDSKIRISGPNIVFVAVASSIVARAGFLGLSLCTLLAGVLLMFFGAIGLGSALQRLPRPVAAGFSTGIAVLVVTSVLPGLLGIGSQVPADEVLRGSLVVLRHVSQIEPHVLILAVATLTLIAASRRKFRRLPVGLAMIVAGALLVKFEHFPVRTVESVYGSGPVWYHLHAAVLIKSGLLDAVLGPALAIAVLVGIESVQAIRVASNLTGEIVDPDGELLLHGGVNVASAVVGGLPASGASSYTSENALLGAQTPFAGMLQAVFLVVLWFVTASVVRFIPLPVISAIILLGVCSMTHWREIPQVIRLTRTEVAVWLAVSVLTITADLSVAIPVGMFIGMLLYIRDQREPGLAKPVRRAAS